MKIAVRYYSRGGNTKLLADCIATSLKTNAISVTDDRNRLEKDCDVLFIGGALYAYGIDKKLKEYILNLESDKIKKAVVFSTSLLSKHAVSLIKKYLKQKDIEVVDDYIYYRGKLKGNDIKPIKKQAEEIISKYK